MTILAVVWAIASGLAINEFSELSPWAARKVIRWSAGVRYTDQARAEARSEELAALVDARPGKLLKLITALCFAGAAICAWVRRFMAGIVAGGIRVTAGGALALNIAMTASLALAAGLALYDSLTLPTASHAQSLPPWNVYGPGSGNVMSVAFLPNEYAEQAFRSAAPLLDRVGVVVGLDQRNYRSAGHALEIQLLDSSGTVLSAGFAELTNNGFTTIDLRDVRVNPGETYCIRVWNRSADVLGIYVAQSSSVTTNVGSASVDGTSQPGILAGFVEGRGPSAR